MPNKSRRTPRVPKVADRHPLMRLIGGTPLIPLSLSALPDKVEILCKLESRNPGGSVKDRCCRAVLHNLEAEGKLHPGDTIVEASAGNSAISMAMICAALNYKLVVVMPESVPVDRYALIELYGAEIVFTPAATGMKGAAEKAEEISSRSDRNHLVDHFRSPANPEVHRRTTGPEILKDLGRAPDVFIAAVGTGGTITGVGEMLKKKHPSVKIVAVEPAESAVLSGGNPGPHGIVGIGPGFIPDILNTGIIDEVVPVSTEQAHEAVRMLAAETGILGGLSSGAAVHAALRVASAMPAESSIVTIVGDAGHRWIQSAEDPSP